MWLAFEPSDDLFGERPHLGLSVASVGREGAFSHRRAQSPCPVPHRELPERSGMQSAKIAWKSLHASRRSVSKPSSIARHISTRVPRARQDRPHFHRTGTERLRSTRRGPWYNSQPSMSGVRVTGNPSCDSAAANSSTTGPAPASNVVGCCGMRTYSATPLRTDPPMPGKPRRTVPPPCRHRVPIARPCCCRRPARPERPSPPGAPPSPIGSGPPTRRRAPGRTGHHSRRARHLPTAPARRSHRSRATRPSSRDLRSPRAVLEHRDRGDPKPRVARRTQSRSRPPRPLTRSSTILSRAPRRTACAQPRSVHLRNATGRTNAESVLTRRPSSAEE